jgi:hypothetical protein
MKPKLKFLWWLLRNLGETVSTLRMAMRFGVEILKQEYIDQIVSKTVHETVFKDCTFQDSYPVAEDAFDRKVVN